MRVMFNRLTRRGPWGGGAHWQSAMVDYLESRGHDVVFSLESEDIDIIVMMDPRHEDGGYDWTALQDYKKYNSRTKLLHRINECDARKGTNDMDRLLLDSNRVADETVFISQWLKDYFGTRGYNNTLIMPAHVVYNGCRSEWFHPGPEKKLSRPIKLVTHHWSDNHLKGFDLYHALDNFVAKNADAFEFTYVGRYNGSYAPKYTKIIAPLYGKELADELRKHDVYVTATRQEPCGLHHVEGAACGMPVLYHADSGGVKDYVETFGGYGREFHDSKTFEDSLHKVVKDYDSYKDKIPHARLGMDRCAREYYEVMENMLK